MKSTTKIPRKRKIKIPTPTESALCRDFVYRNKIHQQYNIIPEVMTIHIPNEGKRSYNIARQLLSMGMLTGCADYLILLYGGRVIAIEFKRDKTCKLTDAQKAFRDQCLRMKIPYLCTYQVDEALEFVKLHAKSNTLVH